MPTLTSLKQLSYLVALADRLNFTRAAEQCFVTQSTLSAGLKELESLLGARLVERDRQTVLMTPLGLQIVERASAILAAGQDLVDLARVAAAPMTGLLRIGVIPTIAPFLLPQCLTTIREHYPKLQVALREDVTASLLARLDQGQLDFALIALPYDTGNLLVTQLFDDELLLVGLKNDPLLQPKTISVSQSWSDRLLLLEEGHCLRDHTLYACGTSNPRALLNAEATSLLTLVQMIESGLGIALVPELAVRSGLTSSGNLVARRLIKPGPKRCIALVTRRTTPRLQDLTALARVFGQRRRRAR